MRALALTLALAGAACGGGKSTSSGAGLVVTGPLAATLGNAAGVVASGACTPPGVSAPVGGGVAAIGVSTGSADLCAELAQGQRESGATVAELTLLRLNANGQPQAITTGAYTITTGSLPSPDPSGNYLLALVTVSRNGTSAGAGQGCAVAATSDAVSGSVAVTSVSASAIAGTVNAALPGSAGVSGGFTATICSGAHSLDASTCDVAGIPSPTSCL